MIPINNKDNQYHCLWCNNLIEDKSKLTNTGKPIVSLLTCHHTSSKISYWISEPDEDNEEYDQYLTDIVIIFDNKMSIVLNLYRETSMVFASWSIGSLSFKYPTYKIITEPLESTYKSISNLLPFL